MPRPLALPLLACALLASCGGGDTAAIPDAAPPVPDADLSADAAPPDAPIDASPPAPDAAPPFPTCLEACTSPADCVTAGGALFDAENYVCEDNHCRWIGCMTTAECVASYGPGWVCGTVTGSSLPNCYEGCSAAADCVIAGGPLYDVDNWTCEVGKCRWLGCQSTSECTTSLMDPDYTCFDTGPGLPICLPTCTTPSDCTTASTLYDADNYDCQAGVCRWLGCHSTSECIDAFMSPEWVCATI